LDVFQQTLARRGPADRKERRGERRLVSEAA
jgi:hypothetical protein